MSLWLLTVAGGGVDAVILLGFNVLTAAQTGNTVLLAVALVRGDTVGGTSAVISVLAFVLGTALGARMLGQGSAGPASFFRLLLVETLLLLGLMAFWVGVNPLDRHEALAVIALAASAMGLQSAVALCARGPSTTYETGTLTAFGTGLVAWLRSPRRQPGSPLQAPDSASSVVPGPWRNGYTWLLYLISAVGCGVLFLHFDVLALLIPAVAVGLAALLQPGSRTGTPAPH